MAAPGLPGWEAAILHGVGAPVTAENLRYMNAWLAAEGGSAANNPFNTTQPASGASSYNSVGVRNYTSPQQGIVATIQTLLNGRYEPILSGLRSGASAVQTAQGLSATPWGTGAGVLRVLGAGNVPSGAAAAGPAYDPAAGLVHALSSQATGAPVTASPLASRLASLIGKTNQSLGLPSSGGLAQLLAQRLAV